ncbi:threonine synthase [Litorivicinus lipolyticus]|uniref:Threonine synthase n=1 Tax=Litorivicinus lipolyticus TaxID=418701 RepID=A0A5Q2QH29_9GAMM|nr:threonine synthase [Litorivicinus lipolyticus]QGG81326.1 threonine synthase [Litorivicinus lipolyticus]
MRYVSTRGRSDALDFEGVLLRGLAPDGGLYVPESLPTFSPEQLREMAKLSYAELALEVTWPFVDGFMPKAEYAALLTETYAEFNHPAVAPLKQLDSNLWLLEQFHGPTLAFKDFALQLLGRLLNLALARKGERGVVLGATSGDTGSAAIEGCRHGNQLDVFILHPHERVSDVQRRQMTTVLDPSVFNIAVQGDFDDCQAAVKASFNDQSFLNGKRLIAVNSINWARVMAQIVYFFYSGLRLGAPDKAISFAVPSANFGHMFAGHLASQMGLPVEQFIVATNHNDALDRSIKGGVLARQALSPSLSPSMDIVVSSNFERLLYALSGGDSAMIDDLMKTFAETGHAQIPAAIMQAAERWTSGAVDDAETVATIKRWHAQSGEILDPHTAIGVRVAEDHVGTTPMICMATAHPAKFAEAVVAAGLTPSALPSSMADLMDRQERYQVLANDVAAIQAYVAANI